MPWTPPLPPRTNHSFPRPHQDAGCIPVLAAALSLDTPTAGAAVSALCALCSSPRALQELVRADGAGALLSSLSRLQGRSHHLALRLLRRLAKASGVARVKVQDALAGMGLQAFRL